MLKSNRQGVKMLVNLKEELLPALKAGDVKEWKLTFYGEKPGEFQGVGNTIPWDSLPALTYDDTDPGFSGWVSFNDGSWSELEEVDLMGLTYYNWASYKCPSL